jgi:hypothetical protein
MAAVEVTSQAKGEIEGKKKRGKIKEIKQERTRDKERQSKVNIEGKNGAIFCPGSVGHAKHHFKTKYFMLYQRSGSLDEVYRAI